MLIQETENVLTPLLANILVPNLDSVPLPELRVGNFLVETFADSSDVREQCSPLLFKVRLQCKRCLIWIRN